jgi:hypothetical protein
VDVRIQHRRHLIGAAAVLATLCLVAACSTGGSRSGTGNAADPGTSGTHSHSAGVSAPPPAPLRAGEHLVNLTMPQPYTPQAPNGGTDEYRCFLIDPKLTSRAFLTGSQFLPQNADIVHHAIFFRLSPEQVAEAQKLDEGTPGEGWTCFGDSGVKGDAAWVAHWAPGVNETLLTPGVGYDMPAGSQIVMQVHYNLLASGGKPEGADQSSIRLRLTDGATELRPLVTARLLAPIELPCTASESGPLCDRQAAVADVLHRFGEDVGQTVVGLNELCNGGKEPVAGATQHCDRKIPQGATAYAVAGHMHLLGRSIKIELNPDTPQAQTLLDIPAYNFDDQAIRPLATPVAITAGDNLRVTCTHDAGLRKLLPQLKTLPPRYVVWGDGTSDEMCLGLVIVAR